MRSTVMTSEKTPLSITEVTLGALKPNDVIVAMEASPFCITDWLVVDGHMGVADRKITPSVLGHSAVGTVLEVGTSATGHRVGDRVIVPATPECGRCRWCIRGRMDQCAALFDPPAVIGTLEDGTAVTAYGNVGSYAELIKVRDFGAFTVDSDLPSSWLSMIGCGICSGIGAVTNVAQIEPGSTVAVFGCGQIGLWMIQAARLCGAAEIFAVDPIDARLQSAKRAGATHLVSWADGGAIERIRELTKGVGVDYGMEAGGTASAVIDTFSATALGGVVVLTALESRSATVTFPLFDLALRGRDVRSAQSGRTSFKRDIPKFVQWMESGVIDAEMMLGRTYCLNDINDAMDAARHRTELTPIIVP